MSEINDTKDLPEGIFLVNLKLIHQYQRKEASLMHKYHVGTYNTFYFSGRNHIYLILIKCDGNIVITLILQSYVLH